MKLRDLNGILREEVKIYYFRGNDDMPELYTGYVENIPEELLEHKIKCIAGEASETCNGNGLVAIQIEYGDGYIGTYESVDITGEEINIIKDALEHLHNCDLLDYGDENIKTMESVMTKLGIEFQSWF